MDRSSLERRRVPVVDDECVIALDLEQGLQDEDADMVRPGPTGLDAPAPIKAERRLDTAALDVDLGSMSVLLVAVRLLDQGVPIVAGCSQAGRPARPCHVSRPWKPARARRLARAISPDVSQAA